MVLWFKKIKSNHEEAKKGKIFLKSHQMSSILYNTEVCCSAAWVVRVGSPARSPTHRSPTQAHILLWPATPSQYLNPPDIWMVFSSCRGTRLAAPPRATKWLSAALTRRRRRRGSCANDSNPDKPLGEWESVRALGGEFGILQTWL